MIAREKKEMARGNNLLHGAGRGFKMCLATFAVNRGYDWDR